MSLFGPFRRISNNNQDKIHKCIVLDLDETLVSTFRDEEPRLFRETLKDKRMISERSRVYTEKIYNVNRTPGHENEVLEFIGVTRPYLTEFLEYCVNTFDVVCVWSAGSYKYVHMVVNFIFKDVDGEPDLIFTREECDFQDNTFKKPLIKVINYFNNTNLVNRYNTFIVDDKDSYILQNDKNKHILADAYIPGPNIEEIKTSLKVYEDEEEDTEYLLKLIDYFETPGFRDNTTVSKYIV